MFQRVAIFGLGLLGGSICKSLRRRGRVKTVTGYARNPSSYHQAIEDNVVDEVLSIESIILKGIDLIVVATPVLPSLELIGKVLSNPELGSESIVIDVGSVKGVVINEALRFQKADRFVGCHPMAGSEKTGYDNSTEDLFDGTSVIIVPHEKNRRDDIERVRSFWNGLGANAVTSSAENHDSLVAKTSHLPHLLACGLIDNLAAITGESNIEDFIGNGFRDMTRIAEGSPDMWADILATNSDNILDALEHTYEVLKDILMKSRDAEHRAVIHRWLSATRELKGRRA